MITGFIQSDKPLRVRIAIISGIVILLLIITVGVWVMVRSQSQNGQTALAQAIAHIGKHVQLPTDETPALATITDPAKVGPNKFLSQGQKDDQLLIYAKWKRAILYRPRIDRIIDIGPVDVGQQ